VTKLVNFQVGWEKINGEDRVQDAGTIAAMKETHATKFKFEEESRKRKNRELSEEKKEAIEKKNTFMEEMNLNIRDLITTMKPPQSDGSSSSSATSSSTIRNAMMGEEDTVSRAEFNDLLESNKKSSSDIATILALLQKPN
jgi:hypothetical protein